ncbi:MAG: hypothetical protein A2898_02285 [Candidatus Kerfeldbacteria bacterium RIFCSPLOWO2_01_FULL_48_11]|uniref:Transposase IS200-like domain-containing protein n=1 Tax=Candidatus Kerfeldbacteria bacterium RIFCSPLOWO2_01_FULL_48_11 TaxID=1798543 RepID=A0A1G2B4D6_9BACT|nr:MAG: hypothetical protein UY34_C0015G0021 [Parcubacteria group bacterium GW2011_GWA2_48_9]KKW16388.1 MAG: hypothetical protein UY52_C0005G0023 [Parcubacteria group bacterium GW2011_GWC2_49_9]OGY83087.1 MAG: hypothetical protein A2898_02285 [Candidatus Kerfeldbacteria bacterium RIFCSPLOWO2_01_FULL_48_11]HCM68119.1 hypothetical protein [Candidatus Kerfeldbacteria bacterium]
MSLPRFNEESYCHFITTKTFRNKRIFRDERCREITLHDVDFYRKKIGFKLLGYCIMADHVHMIVWWNTDEKPELTISKIMHDIKGASAKHLSDYFYPGGQGLNALPGNKRGIQAPPTLHNGIPTRYGIKIWQSSFYDFNIYSDKKFREKLNYIHWNPVRAGLCTKPEDWQWSSCRFYEFGEPGTLHIDTI